MRLKRDLMAGLDMSDSSNLIVPDMATVDWDLSNILSGNYDDVSSIEQIEVIDHEIPNFETEIDNYESAEQDLNHDYYANTIKDFEDLDYLNSNIIMSEATDMLRANPNLFDHSNKKEVEADQCNWCINSNHQISNAIDGGPSWWQSPSIAASGYDGHKVTIDLDLRAHFQVAYIIIKAANSPRPGDWVLEKSLDGENWEPWQLFATDATRCRHLTTQYRKQGFNQVVQYYDETTSNQEKPDDSVHCTTKASALVDSAGDQLENGEIIIRLINGRKSQNWPSKNLLEFLTARYIRFRLLKIRTLMADLMSLANDITVTRRYYYSIKDISVGGMCICNGHATSCNVTKLTDGDENSDLSSACECQHNTIGASCEQCKPFFHQYPWRPGTSDFTANATRYCESCNCNDHTDECRYEQWSDDNKMSTDIYGMQSGGGVCTNCQGNTRGVNCQGCDFEFYRDPKADLKENCQACSCNKIGSIGKKFQQSVFMDGFEWRKFLPKENILVDCSEDDYDNPNIQVFYTCEHDDTHDYQCHCKPGYDGHQCDQCAFGWQREIGGDENSKCVKCRCDAYGTNGDPCNYPCQCKTGVTGENCDSCADGYFNFDHGRKPCIACYCSGQSTECSTYNEYIVPGDIYLNQQGWKITEPIYEDVFESKEVQTVGVLADVAQISLTGTESSEQPFRYWAPIDTILKNQESTCMLYGSQLSFSTSTPNVVPDSRLILVSKNDFIVTNCRAEIDENGNNLYGPIDLIEDNFETNRDQFMDILCNLKNILVQATYNEPLPANTTQQVGINYIKINTDDMHNENIEVCECPDGYHGNSCQLCETNYFRNQTSNACQPCNCNGHITAEEYADQMCHPDTGECYKCDEDSHTKGRFCHECQDGYYGDPTTDDQCQECLCPNVHSSCTNFIDKYQCTECPPHQEGHDCGTCKDGYWKGLHLNFENDNSYDNWMDREFEIYGDYDELPDLRKNHTILEDGGVVVTEVNEDGNLEYVTYPPISRPQSPDDKTSPPGEKETEDDSSVPVLTNEICVPCECNGNSNSCDKNTGICHDCQNHSAGDFCETCIDSYYLQETVEVMPGGKERKIKQCTKCQCSETGSILNGICDKFTGQCYCKHDLATGLDCGTCPLNYYNCEKTGCCNCPCISAKAPCDPITAECTCNEGVVGKFCDQCDVGFFNLKKDSGCTKCPCDSYRNDCDPITGECLCPPNTIGEKCELCIKGSFNHTVGLGCQNCECNIDGTIPGSDCSSDNGQCECKEGYKGRQCDQCQFGYYKESYTGLCIACNCDIRGTEMEDCDPETKTCTCNTDGTCNCKTNVTGGKCDTCKQEHVK